MATGSSASDMDAVNPKSFAKYPIGSSYRNASTLGGVIKLLDEQKSDYEVKLSSLISEEARSLILTHAERILLYEGSQTGVADCTVPPYIMYENFSETDDACIRAELLEWMLDSVVSASLLRSGFLKVKGAKVMSSSDHTAKKYIPYKLDPNKSDHRNERDERYSLDLSSRNLTVDLTFDNCHFIRGIKLQDSYTENMIFKRCTIGISQIGVSQEEISINAKNTNVKGDLVFSKRPREQHHEKYKEYNILGNILLESAIVDNLLRLDVGIKGEIEASHLKADTVNLSNSIYFAKVDFEASKIETLICIDSRLVNTFNLYQLKADTVDLANSIYHATATFHFAKIESLFCENSKFYGYPISLEASGLQSNAVFLREGFVALFGATFHKSRIEGDFDCSGGFFGPCYSENSYGMALGVGGSSIRNASFCDGFTSIGMLDISHTIISGTVYFRKGTFLNYNHAKAVSQIGQFKYAIYAHNAYVQQRINFNPPKIYKSDIKKIGNHRLHHLLALHLYYVCHQDQYLKGFIKEFGNLAEEKIPEVGDDSTMLDNNVDKWLYNIQSLLTSQTLNFKVLCLLQSNREGVYEIKDFLRNKKFEQHEDKFAFVYGEAYFEEAHISGQMDCAGAVFFHPDPKLNCKSNEDDWCNALTLSYTKIDGVLYLNNGDKENQLPMLVKGEVDLQYAHFHQLFICPILASDEDNTRWKLIGTTYDAITADKKNKQSSVGNNKWIYYYRGAENRHQPYNQLAGTLYNNGDDDLARQVIIEAPREGLQKWLMQGIRFVTWAGLPAYRSFLALVFFWLLGSAVFYYAARHGFIVSTDKIATIDEEAATLTTAPAVNSVSTPVIYFSAWVYSLEQLIPVIDLNQKEFFKKSYRPDLQVGQHTYYPLHVLYTVASPMAVSVLLLIAEWHYLLLLGYFILHPLAGTLFLAIFLLGIARIRRNS